MIIKEYRIMVPLTLEEYVRGQLYSTAKVSRAETKKGEGVEVLVNEPTEHPQYGKGQYTKKIYHLGNRLPSFIKFILPAKALLLEEEAWNCFPYCKTIIKSPMFPDSLTFTIETMHVQDKGTEENVLKMLPEQLKKRKVDFIDIANERPESKHYNKDHDPLLWHSNKTGRGPLGPKWWENPGDTPVMCCYKTVTYEFKNRLLGGTVEKFMEKFERDLFYRFHRELVCGMDEWIAMSIADIRDYEKQTAHALSAEIVAAPRPVEIKSADTAAAAASDAATVAAALDDEQIVSAAAEDAEQEMEKASATTV